MAVTPRSEFSPDKFTPTEWDSSQDKAVAAEQVARFVESGFAVSKFTKAVYHTLYQHLFSHIAHFDRHGFYAEWFSTPDAQRAWVTYVCSRRSFAGSPQHTWCDVEEVLAPWVAAHAGLAHR